MAAIPHRQPTIAPAVENLWRDRDLVRRRSICIASSSRQLKSLRAAAALDNPNYELYGLIRISTPERKGKAPLISYHHQLCDGRSRQFFCRGLHSCCSAGSSSGRWAFAGAELVPSLAGCRSSEDEYYVLGRRGSLLRVSVQRHPIPKPQLSWKSPSPKCALRSEYPKHCSRPSYGVQCRDTALVRRVATRREKATTRCRTPKHVRCSHDCPFRVT